MAAVAVRRPEVKSAPLSIPAWTTSRIVGSPEPPTPYKVARVFPKLKFKNPTLMAFAPGSDRTTCRAIFSALIVA